MCPGVHSSVQRLSAGSEDLFHVINLYLTMKRPVEITDLCQGSPAAVIGTIDAENIEKPTVQFED